MRLIVLTLALLPAAAAANGAAPLPEQPETARCSTGADVAGYRRGSLAARRLAQEPPAALIASVYRKVDGCPMPVVLRRNVGADNGGTPPTISGDAKLRPLR